MAVNRVEELEKIVEEQALVIAALTQRIKELEERLNMNSGNSSKPPSSDQWNKQKSQRKNTGKKPGGQKGHKGRGLKIECEPDKIVELKPEVCERCGTDISDLEGSQSNARYKIDIEIKTIITKYVEMEVVCPKCKIANRGSFPDGINSRVQYGESLRAVSVLFTDYAMVSYDKTQKIMNDVFGIPISAGTIANHRKDFAKKSNQILMEIAEKLKKSKILNCDETGLRATGKNYWLHTASNSEATYNTVHRKRGSEGTNDNGVLKEFIGTAVHDCWRSYFKYGNCTHALCNAHLLRELQGVIDSTKQNWAEQMQNLLREMKAVVDRYKNSEKEGLSRYYSKKFADSYDCIIALGKEENPLSDTPKKKRKRTKSRCLLDRFIAYRNEICRFTDDFNVPFDNNQAERDIRNAKVKQKVSGGFRSEEGAKNFGKISSVIGTAVKQKLSVFNAVSGIISGSVSSLFLHETSVTE